MRASERCSRIRRGSRTFCNGLILFFLPWLPAFGAANVPPRPVKRVLLLYSDNVRLPFSQVEDETFRSRLSNLSQEVQVYAENLDSFLFTEDDPEFVKSEPGNLVASLYRKKYKNVHFDALVAIKPAALEFLLVHRSEIFGNAPIVFCDVNSRSKVLEQLPPGVSGAAVDYSLLPSLNLIQRLQPNVQRIAAILGSSPRELRSEEAVRAEMAANSPDIPVEFWTGLTPDELQAKLSQAPKELAVLYLSEARDRFGHAFVPRDFLEQIAPTSKVPIYSIATTYLGTGTVGGKLVDAKADAGMAADFVERILSGENPNGLKPVVEPSTYAFDDRALKKFGISETRLPLGSEVLFREPAGWQSYRPYILAAVLFLLLEAVLITALLFERRRAKKTKAFLERRFSIEKIIAECATRLSECPADEVDEELKRGLRSLLCSEKADRASWFVIDDSGSAVGNVLTVQAPDAPESSSYISAALPWITEKLLSGDCVAVASLADLPKEAKGDRLYFERQGVKSVALVPGSHVGARGVLVLIAENEHREWPVSLTDRLEVLGSIFANAFMRKQAQQATEESEERFRYLFTKAPIGIALEDLEGKLLFANPALSSMLGYTQEELTSMNCAQFADEEDEKEDWDNFQAMCAGLKRSYQIEKRYRKKDRSQIWGRLNVSMLTFSEERKLILATIEDITEKRAALEDLQRAHSELQELAPRLISAQEDERRRISRELHDDIGQRLALLRIRLDVMQNQTPIERRFENPELSDLLAELDELTEDVHNMSHRLHSTKLDHLGLSAALKEICRQLAAQHHMAIELNAEEAPQPVPEEVSLCFYRVAQEALTNAVKHSRSTRIDVSMMREGSVLKMRIKDYGIGFDTAVRRSGLGLVTMQERLKMIGGALRIDSVAGGGTELEAEACIETTDRSAEDPSVKVA